MFLHSYDKNGCAARKNKRIQWSRHKYGICDTSGTNTLQNRLRTTMKQQKKYEFLQAEVSRLEQ
jgi:predicted GTPase